jgi:hypothetical protein
MVRMKLQQITRGKSKYYHVYLPKNIVERVLHWNQGENLEYKVISNNLILKKSLSPVDKYQEMLSCPICSNHCVIVKIRRNPKRNEYKIVARCPIDRTPVRAIFDQNSFNDWKKHLQTIWVCDLCGGTLEEQVKKFSGINLRARVKLRLFCRDCGRTRVKVIALDMYRSAEINSNVGLAPPIIHKKIPISQKTPLRICPVCEEAVSPEHAFCGSCGTCLISRED